MRIAAVAFGVGISPSGCIIDFDQTGLYTGLQ